MAELPNIIICQCDQLRAYNIGCYGDTVVRTPNIDGLAKNGVRFETAITNNPVCTPARSSLLSGQYSRTCTGMLGNVHQDPPNLERVRLKAPTLPEILRENGYQTALIGKWHIDPQPQLVGFDTALYPKVAHRYYGQTVFNENGQNWIVDKFMEEYFAEQVFIFLKDASKKPFYLNYTISLPHQPIGEGHLPSRYTDMYDREEISLRPNVMKDGKPSFDRFWFNVYTSADYYWRYRKNEPQDSADIVPDDFDLVDLTRLYYGAITCVDDLVGRLIENLCACGLSENTIIVFISDHGDNLGSHGLFNKNSLIEESIRIPLIICGPGISPEMTVTDSIANNIDVMPTLLDMVGLEIPDFAQGHSLLPIIHGDSYSKMLNRAFIETGPMIGIRTERYLFGLHYDESERQVIDGNPWFYDLVEDPLELDNLGGKGVKSDIKNDLRSLLLSWDQNTPWLKAPKHIPHF
jgi:arylsulfatase A-like enzyme